MNEREKKIALINRSRYVEKKNSPITDPDVCLQYFGNRSTTRSEIKTRSNFAKRFKLARPPMTHSYRIPTTRRMHRENHQAGVHPRYVWRWINAHAPDTYPRHRSNDTHSLLQLIPYVRRERNPTLGRDKARWRASPASPRRPAPRGWSPTINRAREADSTWAERRRDGPRFQTQWPSVARESPPQKIPARKRWKMIGERRGSPPRGELRCGRSRRGKGREEGTVLPSIRGARVGSRLLLVAFLCSMWHRGGRRTDRFADSRVSSRETISLNAAATTSLALHLPVSAAVSPPFIPYIRSSRAILESEREREREREGERGVNVIGGDNYLFVASRSRHALVTVLRHGVHCVPILGSRKTSRDNPEAANASHTTGCTEGGRVLNGQMALAPARHPYLLETIVAPPLGEDYPLPSPPLAEKFSSRPRGGRSIPRFDFCHGV